jgi:PAS domain S-box-containing protein
VFISRLADNYLNTGMRVRRFGLRLFLCLDMLLCAAVGSLAGQLPSKIHTTVGPSHNNQLRIVHDSRGLLWFGALDGLSRLVQQPEQPSPPFWQRWWLRALAGLLAAALIFSLERYRAARLKELNAALSKSQQLTEQLTLKQSELYQANQTLSLDAAISHILVEAATPNEAAPRILRAICEKTGWEWSALWDMDTQANVLRCASVWHPHGTAALSFEAQTWQQTFAPGVGLPGRVFATRQAHWIEDLAQDDNFPRVAAALKEGLRSGLGFPILLGSEVIAVIEFFSRTPRRPDRAQLQMLATLGGQLGQLIERKRAEQALRESETRFRTLAETASDAIITIDGTGTIVFVNQATEKVFGYAAAELLGQDLTMLMPEYLRRLHSAGLARYQETGKRHIHWEALELPGLHRDGHEFPLEISFGEFARAGQRYFTGIARDITERKRAEEALRKAREERLRELERVRRRIATDLHDDIGSSLTQISILSEVLRQRLDGNQTAAAEPLEMIASASRELVDAMSDIVWAINPQKDHLSDLTQRMRRFAADSLTARNIRFQLLLPEADADVPLGANLRREVFLIFKESINNIVKHSACSAARIELSFADGYLKLCLSDDGRGFDTTRESEGHGLMSMRDRAYGIGGTLELHSQAGAGTAVTLQVPLEQH